MKKIIFAILLFSLLVGAVLTLSSCKKDNDTEDKATLNGTYTIIEEKYGTVMENTYVFEGNGFTAINKQGDYYHQSINGTYEVLEGKIVFNYELNGKSQSLECSFEEGEDYITTDGVRLEKQ